MQQSIMKSMSPTDLSTPFTSIKITQLRTSKMQQMRNLDIQTGIYKTPRTEQVFCSLTGLQDDEHDLTFHGGPDKAVHQYFPGHYPSWRLEYPESSAFEIGGFGENIVCENPLPGEGGMNEMNVCIGDIYQIGDEKVGVRLQVSLPRQPCFKLNHRFSVKGFAPQTWKKSRTGWYYRVLKEGYIGVGDNMVLVERLHPDWTIERIQEYMNRDAKHLDKLEELEKIEEFGAECKGAIKRLVTKLKNKPKAPEAWRDFTVVGTEKQNTRIMSFTFQALDTEDSGADISPGSFISLKLPNGLKRSYSIVHGSSDRFELGVALTGDSRGGSQYLHSQLKVGDVLPVSKTTTSVPMAEHASNHIFIAGGIGITAFLAHIKTYQAINYNYHLHYATRSIDDIPFKDTIEKMGKNVTIYSKAEGSRMDIFAILKNRVWNTQTYICGPQRMTTSALRAATELGMSQDEIHYEAFQADGTGDPFTVELRKSKKTLSVDGDKTLLETMREAGLEVDSSCETGNCGTCKVDVCEGKVEHRGTSLGEEERRTAMLSCVSRGIGRIVIDF